MTAALGLGTYRIAGEHMTTAALLAAGSPVAWIDTAPNYCHGRAHRLLAPALADHPILRVGTKVGFIEPSRLRSAIRAKVIDDREAAAYHSIGADYVRWQVERNRDDLGRRRLDTVFLHNPERTVRPAELQDDLRSAFVALEEKVALGHVQYYGVATWDGFDRGAFTIAGLDRLAREAAGSGDHHLRVIQMPVSLVSAGAFLDAVDGRGPILQAAWLGWEVHASAPLHGGELPSLATPELADLIMPGADIPVACLAAVASCPGISTVLLSTHDPEHWAAALAAVGEQVPTSNLRSALDVLATPA